MEEIYWLTRLDGIRTILITFLLLSIALLIIFVITRIITDYQVEIGVCTEYNKRWMKIASKWIKSLIAPVVLFSTTLVFVPTTKDAFLIYGVGGAIDWIRSDKVASQIPNKVVLAADRYLEELLSDNDNKENK